MNSVYVFLIRNDVWIYILCALGLFWYTSELWQARRTLRSAMFGLEKERGQQKQRLAIFFIVLLAAIIGGVSYVNIEIAPDLPPNLLKPPTPTPNIFATPLSSPTPLESMRSTPTLVIAPTVTLSGDGFNSPTPPVTGVPAAEDTPLAATETPTLAPVVSECTTAINISAPPNGVSTPGIFTIFGSATADNFAFYRLEANGPQTQGQWFAIVDDVTQPVIDGILGTADLSTWTTGLYLLRLRVIDNTGSDVGQCAVEINLDTG